MRVLITGGTGLIGRNLIKSLVQDGYEVVNVGRTEKHDAKQGVLHVKWDGRSIPESVGKVDVVVNLAGASIAGKRWSDAYKKVLMDSRVDATRACTEFIARSSHKPQVFLSASGYNYYGSLLDNPVSESSPVGDGFMSDICRNWEAATEGAGIRTVLMRISVVMDASDGPLAKMLPAYRFFVGGPTGSGKQGFPWIHIQDMVSAIRFLIDNKDIHGPVNMVAPGETTMQGFSDAIARAIHRPNWFRLPKPVLELIFGEMSVVLWGGAFVQPDVLREAGFKWQFPEINGALKNLLG